MTQILRIKSANKLQEEMQIFSSSNGPVSIEFLLAFNAERKESRPCDDFHSCYSFFSFPGRLGPFRLSFITLSKVWKLAQVSKKTFVNHGVYDFSD